MLGLKAGKLSLQKPLGWPEVIEDLVTVHGTSAIKSA